MDIQLRTYRVTESNGHAVTVQRSDDFIAKLCLGIAGGGFDESQRQTANHLRDALMLQGRAIGRNGCTIELVDATTEVVTVH
jgi:hypothetical protein